MSYFDNLLKKIPKINKILDNDKSSTIYHYTKPEKLLNILKSASIRFSNALYLNDKDEIAYSYKLIVKLIDETPNLETDVFEKIKNHFISKYKHIIDGEIDSKIELEYFTTSFSSENDNLTLWNNYSKGKSYTGYNIGFNKDLLIKDMIEKEFHPIYGSVIYDTKKQAKILTSIFKKWNTQIKNLSNTRKNYEVHLFDLIFELIDILSIVSLFFKNPQFNNEKEYRIVLVNGVDIKSAKQTKIIEKNGLFIPYIEYNFSHNTVSNVNIGPTLDERIFYASTNRMLMNYGYENIDVRKSKIPLRY